MEIVVTARHIEVAERFRRHAEEKLAKVAQLAPRATRLDIELSHETNKRQASVCDRVELTVYDKGPVIRAEACAADLYSALDLAHGKLLERLRRAADRRKVHHTRRGNVSVREATSGLTQAELDGAEPIPTVYSSADLEETGAHAQGLAATETEDLGDSPVVIREKVHEAKPMRLDDALYEMELVGHDFFLFIDSDSGFPSVVYRRHGWHYGVIRLSSDAASGQEPDVEGTATEVQEPTAPEPQRAAAS